MCWIIEARPVANNADSLEFIITGPDGHAGSRILPTNDVKEILGRYHELCETLDEQEKPLFKTLGARLYEKTIGAQANQVPTELIIKNRGNTNSDALISALPWELLVANDQFLAGTEHGLQVSRCCAQNATFDPVAKSPNLIFTSPAPDDLTELNYEFDEAEVIRICQNSNGPEVLVEETGTLAGLEGALAKAGDHPFVHISSHGGKRFAKTLLSFEHPCGEEDEVSLERLRSALLKNPPSLCFLANCYSAEALREPQHDSAFDETSRSLAEQIGCDVPIVVGFASAVLDSAAIAIGREFYRELAAGSSPARALANARNVLLSSSEPLQSDWHLARLYVAPNAPTQFSWPARTKPTENPETFLGRRRSIQQLHRAFEDGHVALICGVEGVGKSALVQRVARNFAGLSVLDCSLSSPEEIQNQLNALGKDQTGPNALTALDNLSFLTLTDPILPEILSAWRVNIPDTRLVLLSRFALLEHSLPQDWQLVTLDAMSVSETDRFLAWFTYLDLEHSQELARMGASLPSVLTQLEGAASNEFDTVFAQLLSDPMPKDKSTHPAVSRFYELLEPLSDGLTSDHRTFLNIASDLLDGNLISGKAMTALARSLDFAEPEIVVADLTRCGFLHQQSGQIRVSRIASCITKSAPPEERTAAAQCLLAILTSELESTVGHETSIPNIQLLEKLAAEVSVFDKAYETAMREAIWLWNNRLYQRQKANQLVETALNNLGTEFEFSASFILQIMKMKNQTGKTPRLTPDLLRTLVCQGINSNETNDLKEYRQILGHVVNDKVKHIKRATNGDDAKDKKIRIKHIQKVLNRLLSFDAKFKAGDSVTYAYFLSQKSHLKAEMKRVEEAIRIRMDEVMPLFKGNAAETARTWVQIAEIHRENNDYLNSRKVREEEVIPIFNAEIKALEGKNDPDSKKALDNAVRELAMTYIALANLASESGDHKKAIDMRNELALPVFQKGEYRRLEFATHAKIAQSLELSGSHEEALERRKQLLVEFELYLKPIQVHETKFWMAKNLRSLGELDDALKLVTDALNGFRLAGKDRDIRKAEEEIEDIKAELQKA